MQAWRAIVPSCLFLQSDANDVVDLSPAAFKQPGGDLWQGRLHNPTVTVPEGFK